METLNKIEMTYRRLKSEGREILKLFSGNPNDEGFIFPGNILEEEYARHFRNQDYRPHSKGLFEARQSISNYYASQRAFVDPENILLTSGTSESFDMLFSLLTQPGDNVLAPNPAYPLFDYIADLSHIELRHYPLLENENWRIDIEALKKRTDNKTKAIILISPNNPTGAVASEAEIQEIVAWANKKNIALICDEVFSEFYYGPGKFPRAMEISKPNLCFTLNGLSKMFALPALKLGWMAVTGEKSRVDVAVDRLETIADTFLSCHIPIQKALPKIFEKGGEFLKNYKAEVGKRRELAIKLLKESPNISFVEPVGGFYLMAKISGASSEEGLVIRLLEETGVFVHPGYFFDYEKGVHLVMSYLCQEEKLRNGLGKILELL